jgi:ferritin-like metal-binding protein YciE
MNLKELFLDELADIHFAENHIAKALPKMAKASTDKDLKEAILSHLEETKGHIEKVKQVFAAFDEKPKSKECKATLGLLAEGDDIAADNKGEPTINAAIISACQKVEHYEIASYGALHAWAQLLGNDEAATLIEEILNEEKAADEKLTELSGDNNQQALDGDCEDCGESKTALLSGKK